MSPSTSHSCPLTFSPADRKLFLALLALCFVFWFPSLSDYAISIDQEFAATQLGLSNWAQQGRWAVYLLARYVLPQPVIPYFPHLLLMLGLVTAYLLLLRTLNWQNHAAAVWVFPLFAAHPCWYFIGGFYANLLSLSVGLALVSTAALLTTRALQPTLRFRGLVIHLILAALSLGTALATYQSFLLAFSVIMLGTVLLRPQGQAPLPAGRWLLIVGVVNAAALIVYMLVSAWFKYQLNVSSAYIDGFINPGHLMSEPIAVLRSVFFEMQRFYRGAAILFGIGLSITGIVLVLGLGGRILSSASLRQAGFLSLVVLGMLILPFTLQFLAGGGGTIPYRSMVAVPFVFALAGLALLSWVRGRWHKAVYVLMCLAGFQLLNAHAYYSADRQLALAYNRDLAAAVYTRIQGCFPDFSTDQAQKVDFFGAAPFQSVFNRPYSSTIGHSFFDWDGGNPVRIYYFMRLIGYQGLSLIQSDERARLQSNYADMPVWPAQGAVRCVDQTALVKLGPKAGYVYPMHLQLIDNPG